MKVLKSSALTAQQLASLQAARQVAQVATTTGNFLAQCENCHKPTKRVELVLDPAQNRRPVRFRKLVCQHCERLRAPQEKSQRDVL